MNILVTGGGGFIGSHVAEYFAKNEENQVIAIDNLTRNKLLSTDSKWSFYNWNYLHNYKNIILEYRNMMEPYLLNAIFKEFDIDVVIHTAAQTAVTSSITNPKQDFENNCVGTFRLLEAIRISDYTPSLIFCSTNKVYGDNINLWDIKELETRYTFKQISSISEAHNIDRCEHSPYGVSKLCADLYTQEYGQAYGIKTGVFRMSCIYGTRQFGVEDQGWVAHFILSALQDKTINIYGNGKQVRDILYISDLIHAYNKFICSNHKNAVYNIGGGSKNTISLLELIQLLEEKLETKLKLQFYDWRLSDQKVYISDISRITRELNWKPYISINQGIQKLIHFYKKILKPQT